MKKIKVSALGILIVSSILSNAHAKEEGADCSELLETSVCEGEIHCQEVSFAEVVKKLEENGCLKNTELKVMENCGNCAVHCKN